MEYRLYNTDTSAPFCIFKNFNCHNVLGKYVDDRNKQIQCHVEDIFGKTKIADCQVQKFGFYFEFFDA
jgi:hypothetical protein